LDLAAFAAFGREEPKVTTVSAKYRKIGTGLVVIVSAALQLVFSWKGREYLLSTLEQGDCFGEMAS
jgi:hypothetical protein